ncbi:MAG: hypothetical protein ACK2UW_12920 [Anaerolineales bacterium]
MRHTVWTRLAFAVLALWMLSGCRAVARPEQPARDGWFELENRQPAGQTFTADFDGVNGIQVFLRRGANADGGLQLSLKNTPQDHEALATAALPAGVMPEEEYIRFDLPSQPDSARQDFYFELKTGADGGPYLGTAEPAAYLDGAMYVDGQPVDAQLTFLLDYGPLTLVAGLGRELLSWLGMLLAAGFLFILPGWGLLGVLWPAWKSVRWPIRLGLSGGVSLAIYPLLFLWTSLIGLKLGAAYAWLPGILGLGLLVWSYRGIRPAWRWERFKTSFSLYNVLFVLVLGLIIFSRFWNIRGLDLPLWGDGYQHTMIVQLLLDNGGLFQSWLPYSELSTFTYHYGFHAAAAVFAWLTGMTAAQAVLWTGQLLNILAVLAVLPLAEKIGKPPWTPLLAAMMAGLLLNMPSFYLNWARYTQLAGQVILPAAVFFAWLLLEQPRISWKLMAASSLMAAGLALTHYRIVIFAVLFLPAFWILQVRKANLVESLKSTLVYGLASSVLALPWLVNLARGRIPAIFGNQISTSASSLSTWEQAYNAIGALDVYLPFIFWIALALAVGWLLWQRSRPAAIFSLWWFLIFLATNPNWLGLPGTGAISNFTLFIAAYLPASILIAAALTRMNWFLPQQPAAEQWQPAWRWVALVVVVVICGWSAVQRLRDVDPAQYALAVRPDLRAADWISAHTPEDARFLVNAFSAFGETALVGADGGWWLPLTANRQTLLTPLTASFEKSAQQTGAARQELVEHILELGVDAPQSIQDMQSLGLTHVYVGQKQGQVNSPQALLEVEDLLRSPHFSPVYHQDRVWIFEIDYANNQP